MPDIRVVTIGVQGPAGPATVSAGTVITTRGAALIGNASGQPAQLLIGPSGQYWRSNGSDPVYSAIQPLDLPTGIDAARLANGAVSNTEFQFLDGLTSNAQAQINSKAATAHSHITAATRGIATEMAAQSAATPSDNTASTTIWANGLSFVVTLPIAATWRLQAHASLLLKHANNATSLMRVVIGSNDTTGRSLTVSSTVWTPCQDTDELIAAFSGAGLAVTILVQFRSSDPGTTFAANPGVLVFAERQS